MRVTRIKQPLAYAIVWVVCVVLWAGPGIAAEWCHNRPQAPYRFVFLIASI
jgi:hypothetical protein